VKDECGVLVSHKTHRGGCGICAREEKEPPTIKNEFSIGETQKGGVTLLENASQGQKSNKMKG
jgi:hypothetical protein